MTGTNTIEEGKCGTPHRTDAFVATVLHELRNPLASLRTAIQLLGTAADDPTAVARLQARMDRQLAHLARVIDDALDTTRITRGELTLRVERTSATAIVRMAVELSEPLLHAASHRLSLDLPNDPLWIDVDPLRLTQIITNLLHNAAKYTNPKGTITVGASRCGDRLEIYVRDTGIGMTPEELDTVFELFARSRHHAVRATGGLGIGLALARRLAEMHRGSLTATSGGLGSGSQFTLNLPTEVTAENALGDVACLYSEAQCSVVRS
jgi:signal transduction histidine kinase